MQSIPGSFLVLKEALVMTALDIDVELGEGDTATSTPKLLSAY